ncbi:acyltransferase family protein [Blastococcus sp. SYSU DS0619]
MTGTRFLAALAVVLLHVTASRVNDEPLVDLGPVAGRVAELGYLGVTLFFALSGFVLTWSATGITLSARAFYRRRLARIYPLHLATALAAGIAGAVLGVTFDPGAWAAVLLLVQAWIPDPDWYFALNGVSWSLSCEAFFYAVTPFLLRAAVRRSTRGVWAWVAVAGASVLVVSAVVVATAPGWDQRIWVSPWYSIVSFLGGTAVALTLERRAVRWPSLRVAGAVAIAVLAALVLGSWEASWPRSIATFLALPAVLVFLGAAASHDLSGRPSWLSRPGMVRLGEWSFALYLVHPLVMHALLRGWGLPVLHGPAAVAGLLGFLAVAVLAAAVAYHALERPAERVLRGRRRAETAPAQRVG